MKHSQGSIVVLLLIGTVIIIGGAWLTIRNLQGQTIIGNAPPLADQSLEPLTQQPTQTPTIKNTPVPPPNPPLPQGKTPFTVSSGKKDGPQFSQGFIDPYDPAVGKIQSVTVAIQDPAGIQEASAILQTDKTKETYPLKKINGTETRGDWRGEWTVRDTHNTIYRLTLVATNKSGKQNKVEMTLR